MKKVKTAKRVKCHRKVPYFEHLQYMNLRKNYNRIIDHVLGEDYYNTASDVYNCDDICANDIIKKYNEESDKKYLWAAVSGVLVTAIMTFFGLVFFC